MNQQEPSKVTLDYHHLEKLFNDRARLFQSQEEIGRLRKEIKKNSEEVGRLLLPGDVEYEKVRKEAFADIQAAMDKWRMSDCYGSLADLIGSIIHSEPK